MPKMKTHKGAAKRFKITGSGKVKRSHAYTGHFMGRKTAKQKRNLRQSAILTNADEKRIKRLLPYQ